MIQDHAISSRPRCTDMLSKVLNERLLGPSSHLVERQLRKFASTRYHPYPHPKPSRLSRTASFYARLAEAKSKRISSPSWSDSSTLVDDPGPVDCDKEINWELSSSCSGKTSVNVARAKLRSGPLIRTPVLYRAGRFLYAEVDVGAGGFYGLCFELPHKGSWKLGREVTCRTRTVWAVSLKKVFEASATDSKKFGPAMKLSDYINVLRTLYRESKRSKSEKDSDVGRSLVQFEFAMAFRESDDLYRPYSI